jgi:predicted enzyme related to lactoylglutathione lyase
MNNPTFQSVTPILLVSDLQRALDFYQRVMGFEPGWIAGEPPRIASVCRDSIEIMVRKEATPTRSQIYIGVDGVDEYHQRLSAAGAKVTVPLDDRHYGIRDFTIEDPDGNFIAIGEPIID